MAIFRGAHSFGEQSNEISKEGYEVNVTDFATFAGTMGDGFLLGTRSLVKLLKKVIKIAPVIVGLFYCCASIFAIPRYYSYGIGNISKIIAARNYNMHSL